MGSFEVANGFGLYDMHGNVWEWCADSWHPSYQDAPSHGEVWDDGDNSSGILRGGSWYINPKNCRSATRNGSVAGIRVNYIGFRVVCGTSRTS